MECTPMLPLAVVSAWAAMGAKAAALVRDIANARGLTLKKFSFFMIQFSPKDFRAAVDGTKVTVGNVSTGVAVKSVQNHLRW